MSFSFIIEIGEDAVGLIHRESENELFRFYSSDRRFVGLDGSEYNKPAKAEAAARQWLRQSRRQHTSRVDASRNDVRFGERFPVEALSE